MAQDTTPSRTGVRAVVYSIDGDDKLCEVNDAWTEFARSNGAAALEAAQVLGRSIWDFLTDSTTVHLYRELVRGVRVSGRTALFPFRCDAPDRVRHLQMEIAATENSRVRFRVTSLQERNRDSVALLSPSPRGGSPMLTMCGWCKRLRLPDRNWVEVEIAVQELGLFLKGASPGISHGICGDCHDSMEDEIIAVTPELPGD